MFDVIILGNNIFLYFCDWLRYSNKPEEGTKTPGKIIKGWHIWWISWKNKDWICKIYVIEINCLSEGRRLISHLKHLLIFTVRKISSWGKTTCSSLMWRLLFRSQSQNVLDLFIGTKGMTLSELKLLSLLNGLLVIRLSRWSP